MHNSNIQYRFIFNYLDKNNENYEKFITNIYEILDSSSTMPISLDKGLETQRFEGIVPYPITNINLGAVAEMCDRYQKRFWLFGNYLNEDNECCDITVYIDSKRNINIKEWWHSEED